MKHAFNLQPPSLFSKETVTKSEHSPSFDFKQDNLASFQDEALCFLYRTTHNQEIIGELFKRHTHRVLGSCIKILKNEEDARDATMEIFEKLFSKLKNAEVSNFGGWLFTVTRNHCLTKLRKKGPAIFQLWNEEVPDPMDDSSCDQDLIRREFWSSFEQALGKLSPGQQDCIVRFYILRQRYKLIAEKANISEKQVKSDLQNGMKSLRKLIGSQSWRDSYSPFG